MTKANKKDKYTVSYEIKGLPKREAIRLVKAINLTIKDFKAIDKDIKEIWLLAVQGISLDYAINNERTGKNVFYLTDGN